MAGACPADERVDAGVLCRESTGACDFTETCDGISSACPADRIADAGVVCRPANGVCDLTELCTGASPQCPPDAFADAGQVCRGAAGTCDAVETCTGASEHCPADLRAAAGTVCRASAASCDVAESCDGGDPLCPDDGYAAAGTPAPACMPFACTGQYAACPTFCLADTECVAPSICVGGQCQQGKRVFLASTVVSGNLGGVDGGDAVCQARATAMNFRGTYFAWLATNALTAPANRFTRSAQPYYLPNGTRVANSYADLTDGTLANPITANEAGQSVTNNLVWTGVTAAGVSSGTNCSGWTTTGDAGVPANQATVGYNNAVNGSWTNDSDPARNPRSCALLGRIYCFQQ